MFLSSEKSKWRMTEIKNYNRWSFVRIWNSYWKKLKIMAFFLEFNDSVLGPENSIKRPSSS